MKTKTVRIFVLALAVCLAALLPSCGRSSEVESAASGTAAQEAAVSDAVPAADTSAPQDTAAGKIDLTAVYAAYLAEVGRVYDLNANGENEYYNQNADDTEFYLYDFDANGVPELMIDHGYKTNTMEEGVSIYTYTAEKGLIHLGNAAEMATFFYDETPGDGDFGLFCFYHDSTAEYQYRIEGETLKETVVQDWRESTMTDDSSEYLDTETRLQPCLIVGPEGWYAATEADDIFARLK